MLLQRKIRRTGTIERYEARQHDLASRERDAWGLPPNELVDHVSSSLGASVTASRITHGELTLDIPRDKIVDVLTKPAR